MDRTWLPVPCPLLLHFVLMRPIIVMMRIRLILSLFLAVLVFHPDIYSKEEARDGLSELRSMYLVAHFPQKQDINQFKWRAMKFVERGGTTRRNRPQCAGFENHSASSHLPYNLPPLVNSGDSTQSWRVQDAHSVSILGPVFANCGFSTACAPHYSGVGGHTSPLGYSVCFPAWMMMMAMSRGLSARSAPPHSHQFSELPPPLFPPELHHYFLFTAGQGESLAPPFPSKVHQHTCLGLTNDTERDISEIAVFIAPRSLDF